MSDLQRVVRRIELGDKVRLYRDFYGQQWLQLSRGWQLWRRRTIRIYAEDLAYVEAALKRRRRTRAPA